MSGMNNTMSRIGNSVITRLLAIGVLVMTLLIPVEMIKGIIRERESRRQDVITEARPAGGEGE
jgi:inner membrane protein